MRYLKRILFFVGMIVITSVVGFGWWASDKYVVPIMMYHNVDYTDVRKANTVSPENFAQHMAYLRDHHYNVLHLDELVTAIKQGNALPHKSVVVTFDDGYVDNYTQAFGILKEYHIPAIIFVPPDLMGTDGFLNWPQIIEMFEDGIDIGSHTRTHAYLPDLIDEVIRDEIQTSKDILEDKLGTSVDYFAYPIGGFSDTIKNFVVQSGYKAACATNRGYDRLNKDVFELNRIRFSDKDVNDFILWAKLSGYYNLFRKLKNPY